MKLAQSVKLGAWFLIALNILMALGSIWIFMRMAPAIDVIIAQNEVSLEASEKMLASLLTKDKPGIGTVGSLGSFSQSLSRAKNNITEKEEPDVLDQIEQNYEEAFKGNKTALYQTINAILELGDINRAAMRRADAKAQQLGYSGAWGVVFMATVTFMIGMIFLRSMKKNILEPMQEIDAVVNAFQEGDLMRRCSMKNPPKSIKQIFSNINSLLDFYVSVRTDDRAQESLRI
jgi:methyl-accepting chemotaxis protein